MVITDEDSTQDLLHGGFQSLIELDQVECKLSLAFSDLLDLIDVIPVDSFELHLIQRHESNAMGQDTCLDQVLCSLLLSDDDVAHSATYSHLDGRAVLFWLLDSKKGGEFAEDGLSRELLIR